MISVCNRGVEFTVQLFRDHIWRLEMLACNVLSRGCCSLDRFSVTREGCHLS